MVETAAGSWRRFKSRAVIALLLGGVALITIGWVTFLGWSFAWLMNWI